MNALTVDRSMSIADKIGISNILIFALEGQKESLADALTSKYGVEAAWLATDPDFIQKLGERLFLCKECEWWHPLEERGDEDDVCAECDGSNEWDWLGEL